MPERQGRWAVWSPFAYRKHCTYVPDDEWIQEDELSDWLQVAIDSKSVVLPVDRIGKWAPFLMMRDFQALPTHFNAATDLDVTILEKSLTQLWDSLQPENANGNWRTEATVNAVGAGELAELCSRFSKNSRRNRDGWTWQGLVATALQSIGAGLVLVPFRGQTFWLPELPLANITFSANQLSLTASQISKNVEIVLRERVEPTLVSGTRNSEDLEVALGFIAGLLIEETNRKNKKIIKDFSRLLRSSEVANYLTDLLAEYECGLAIVPIQGRLIWSPSK